MIDYGSIIENIIDIGADRVNLVDVKEIEFKPKLRVLCEDNICGNYGKNYSCPPYSGTVEEHIKKFKNYDKAIVFYTIENISGLEDKIKIDKAIKKIQDITVNVNNFISNLGIEHMTIGSTACKICSPCKISENKECPFKNNVFTSLSSFCIDIESLSKLCNIDIDWNGNKITNIAMVLIKE